MELRTFQRLSRVADLERDGVLTGDWSRVPEYVREPYRAMVAEMERAGIHTAGRPPVWAWRGPLQLLDASMLFDPEYELSTGYATIRFDAPPELAVVSDYGRWNDFLADGGPWSPGPVRGGLVQVCVPYLSLEWVRQVDPLPVSGWDEMDLSKPV